MGQRLLIAAGTGHYDHLPEDLQRPGLAQVVDSVAGLFTGKLGYSRALEKISYDPTSRQLHKSLDEWLASNKRDCSDWVVIYYTGHGEVAPTGKLYLLTKDYKSGFTYTAFNVEEFATMLGGRDAGGENRKVKRCLLILDTCYSGAGVLSISQELGRLFSGGAYGGMFYLLAAAFPREEAKAGALAKALIQALEDDSLGGAQQRLIYFDQLIPAINRRLKTHKLVYCPVTSPDEEPQFFPNPRFIEGLPIDATVADICRAVTTGELQAFWGPTSRGVELETQPGWYFTGREQILGELSRWLNDPADERTRVITGLPGSGKSAILAKVVTLSDPEYRRLMPQQEDRWSQAFPVENIALAVHAKGKTFQEITNRLAASLGVKATPAEVLTALQSREQPFHIVIDALDEAREPDRIALDLLAPLHSVPKVKLLVGTRPEYANKLGHGAVQLQVDRPQYFEKGDLAKYVTARLLRQQEEGGKSPYQDNPALARQVAEVVAEKAYPNFLIARLEAEDLLARPRPLSHDEMEQSDFPDSVGKAFEQYLSRFGVEEDRVRDLLTPLAWVEGLGLPWANIWPVVASALSGRPYTEEDVRWILERAGSFVVETLERERSVYRLYHQALADHLRVGREETKTQRRIAKALIETVPLLMEGDGRDWTLADSYVRTHLAEHAAACGMFEGLVKDPLFLLSADPERLLSVMSTHADEVPLPIARIYEGAFHQLKTRPLSEGASYLEMEARKSMVTDFADQVARLPLHMAWHVSWAQWLPISTHRILSRSTTDAMALLVAVRQGRTVIIAGTNDRSIRIFDLEQRNPVGAPLTGHTYTVKSLAVAERQGRTVIVSGACDRDASIRIWDLERGEAVGAPLTGHTNGVNALAVAERQGRTVIVSGGNDGRIRIWDLERGEAVGALLNPCRSGVDALAVAERQGRTVIVSGGNDGRIRIWDLERGKTMGAPLTGHTSKVTVLAVAERQGRTVIVSGSWDASIRIWDLERGEAVGAFFTGHEQWVSALAVAERQGRTVIVSGGWDGSIRIWDLERGEAVGAPLTGHTSGVNALAVAERQGRTVIVSASTDHSIRTWDLERDVEVGAPLTGHTYTVKSLAVAERQGRTVIVSGGADKSIHIFDLERGEAAGTPLIGHRGDVTALLVAERQGRIVIVSGSADKSIRIWDLERGEAVCAPLTGHTYDVTALLVAERQGRTVIVSGSGDRIRFWDLERGEAVGGPITCRNSIFRTMVLAVAERQGRTVIVANNHVASATPYRIRIFDLEQGDAVGSPLIGHEHWVSALAVAERQGRTVIVSGSYDYSIRIWDLEWGDVVGGPLTGHTASVLTLAVAEREGRTVIISGSYDNSIRIWDLTSGSLLRTIDVGAPVLSIVFVAPSNIVAGTSMGLIAVRLHHV